MSPRLRSFLAFLKPYRSRIAFIGTCVLISTGLDLGVELLIRPLVDTGVIAGKFDVFCRILGLQALCYAVGVAFNVWEVRSYTMLSADVAFDLRQTLFSHAQKLPVDWFLNKDSGQVPSRILNEVGGISSLVGQALGSAGVSGVQVILAGGILFHLQPYLAVVALALLPLNLWAAKRSGEISAKLESEYYKNYEGALAFLRERLGFQSRLFLSDPAVEKKSAQAFDGWAKSLKDIGLRLTLIPHWFNLASYSGATLANLALYALGGWLIIHGRFTLGGLFAFLAVKTFFEKPFFELANSQINFRETMVHWDRIREILEAPAEERQGQPFSQADICFENIAFSHKSIRIFQDFSAKIPAGRITVISGPSGSGKTTFCSLLMRFAQSESGRILIGGQALSALDINAWRSQAAYVGQDSRLLSGTLRDNLLLYRSEADDHELSEICALLSLDKTIARLPQGLETFVTDEGNTLSGGEKQRLCLARALIKKPALLILDEPTSALDAENEALVLKALSELRRTGSMTLIVVSHGESVLKVADERITLGSSAASPV